MRDTDTDSLHQVHCCRQDHKMHLCPVISTKVPCAQTFIPAAQTVSGPWACHTFRTAMAPSRLCPESQTGAKPRLLTRRCTSRQVINARVALLRRGLARSEHTNTSCHAHAIHRHAHALNQGKPRLGNNIQCQRAGRQQPHAHLGRSRRSPARAAYPMTAPAGAVSLSAEPISTKHVYGQWQALERLGRPCRADTICCMCPLSFRNPEAARRQSARAFTSVAEHATQSVRNPGPLRRQFARLSLAH